MGLQCVQSLREALALGEGVQRAHCHVPFLALPGPLTLQRISLLPIQGGEKLEGGRHVTSLRWRMLHVKMTACAGAMKQVWALQTASAWKRGKQLRKSNPGWKAWCVHLPLHGSEVTLGIKWLLEAVQRLLHGKGLTLSACSYAQPWATEARKKSNFRVFHFWVPSLKYTLKNGF